MLRLAEEEGPQRIGKRKPFVVAPERRWKEQEPERKPMGQWLVENLPRGLDLEVPNRNEPLKAP